MELVEHKRGVPLKEARLIQRVLAGIVWVAWGSPSGEEVILERHESEKTSCNQPEKIGWSPSR